MARVTPFLSGYPRSSRLMHKGIGGRGPHGFHSSILDGHSRCDPTGKLRRFDPSRFDSRRLVRNVAQTLLEDGAFPASTSGELTCSGHIFVFILNAWTLAEYCIHRFVFHGGRNGMRQNNTSNTTDVASFATLRERLKSAAQVLPVLSIPAALVMGGPMLWPSRSALPACIWCTAVFTKMRTACSQTAYGKWCRKVHFSHHFHTPQLNHGVTCPWWDMVFGTYAPETQIQVPERQAMDWLIDPTTGEVYEEYQSDYAIKRKRNAKIAA